MNIVSIFRHTFGEAGFGIPVVPVATAGVVETKEGLEFRLKKPVLLVWVQWQVLRVVFWVLIFF